MLDDHAGRCKLRSLAKSLGIQQAQQQCSNNVYKDFRRLHKLATRTGIHEDMEMAQITYYQVVDDGTQESRKRNDKI